MSPRLNDSCGPLGALRLCHSNPVMFCNGVPSPCRAFNSPLSMPLKLSTGSRCSSSYLLKYLDLVFQGDFPT